MLTSQRIREMARMAEGNDLHAAVLICLFGWEWRRNKYHKLCALVPPADGEIKRVHWDEAAMEPVTEWPKPIERFCQWTTGHSNRTPYPLTDIADAWEVFERGLLLTGNASIYGDMEDYGRGTFSRGVADGVVTVTIGERRVTAPVCAAICRAALMAFADVQDYRNGQEQEAQDAE